MPTIAIISDSHIPERETEIPPPFQAEIEAAEYVIHAGDFTAEAALKTVRTLADDQLTAVQGNMDPRPLNLPPVATTVIAGVTFVVTHGTGSLETYQSRVRNIISEEGGSDAIGIAGHTHEVLDTTLDGIRILNPGSVTGADPANRATMMTAEVTDGTIDVNLHNA